LGSIHRIRSVDHFLDVRREFFIRMALRREAEYPPQNQRGDHDAPADDRYYERTAEIWPLKVEKHLMVEYDAHEESQKKYNENKRKRNHENPHPFIESRLRF